MKAKKVKYYGNIKFCSNTQNDEETNNLEFEKIKDKKVWCAVSTHDDEELFCAKVQEPCKTSKNENKKDANTKNDAKHKISNKKQ